MDADKRIISQTPNLLLLISIRIRKCCIPLFVCFFGGRFIFRDSFGYENFPYHLQNAVQGERIIYLFEVKYVSLRTLYVLQLCLTEYTELLCRTRAEKLVSY